MKIKISRNIIKELEINDALVKTDKEKQDFIQQFVDLGWEIEEVIK